VGSRPHRPLMSKLADAVSFKFNTAGTRGGRSGRSCGQVKLTLSAAVPGTSRAE
jgi:hypothetical protein